MKTILGANPTLSAQTKLNGCPEKIKDSQTLTSVSPPAQIQAQTVRPALTLPISAAPSQVSVFILTSSVTGILSVFWEKMRIYQCAMTNSSK